MEGEFKKGELVEKFKGDYTGPGRVEGVFNLDDGRTRYMVSHGILGGSGTFLHIYSAAQLRSISPWDYAHRGDVRNAAVTTSIVKRSVVLAVANIWLEVEGSNDFDADEKVTILDMLHQGYLASGAPEDGWTDILEEVETMRPKP